MSNSKEYILRVVCPDRFGIVAKVSSCLNESELFILESAHFGDPETNKFFMRTKVISPNKNFKFNYFEKKFSVIAEELGIEWTLTDANFRPKTAIFVSKYSHCLQNPYVVGDGNTKRKNRENITKKPCGTKYLS